AERDGKRVAEVLVGERPVVVLRTAAAGYSPLERAEIVASRLRAAITDEVQAADVDVGAVQSGHGVYVRDQLIVAAYEPEADAHGATTEALAEQWRDNIILALGYELPAEEESPATEEATASAEAESGAAEESTEQGASEEAETAVAVQADDVDWTGQAQKWVPILSLEREGVRLGMAQIAGPTAKVEQVKAVYQLRLDFKNVGRVYAYIPVSAISTKINRVQGVSVWALADIKVLGF
ncbi:MAG: hypothetical protein JXA57_01665, partial [Armatimonadetes bacterium]|nr:hypothetical protein [Armatimonadota bacterium]